MTERARQKVFVEAMALAPERTSGVGHLTRDLVKSLIGNAAFNERYELVLVAPFNKAVPVKNKFTTSAPKFKKLWLPARAIELLARLHLLPPMDLFVGRGIYVFPNYKNWPLRKSLSYTYVHDINFIKHPEFTQPKNLAYLTSYLPAWIKRSTHLLTISNFSKNEIRSAFKVSADKIRVVYPGVDREVFYPRTKEEVAGMRHKYGLPAKYVLFVGNIEPRKNLKRLVEAFAELPESVKTSYALVVIGGDGWLNQDIYEAFDMARAQGAQIIVPDRFVEDQDLPAVYTGASLLVQPALYEGFGLTIIEAMACDLPVAVSNSGSLPEIAGPAAELFDPLQPKDIKEAIVKVLSDNTITGQLVAQGRIRAGQLSMDKSAEAFTRMLIEDAA